MSAEQILADWKAKTDAATAGPWEHGDRQSIAGVKPDMFGEGKCVACERLGEPTWTGRMNINGKVMDAHVHTATEPWWEHGIYAFREDGSLSVVYDTVEYGTMFKPDAEFIAMSRTAVPRLLAAVEAIRALHRPETRYVARDYEEYSFETRSDALEYGEEVTTFDVCVHCGRVETDDDEDRRYRDSIWPCATAKALDAALSGSEPDERNER